MPFIIRKSVMEETEVGEPDDTIPLVEIVGATVK